MRVFIFLFCLFITSPVLSERIEGSAADNIVKNGTIVGSGVERNIATWQLLIKYRSNLYSCLVIFNDAGMDVRFCWTE